jgi:hypothetical protein
MLCIIARLAWYADTYNHTPPHIIAKQKDMGTPSSRQLLLVAAVCLVVVAVDTAAAAAAAAAMRGRRRVHLRVYMHDVIRGPGQTAIQLVWGVG